MDCIYSGEVMSSPLFLYIFKINAKIEHLLLDFYN